MVDISPKPEVYREATAKGTISLKPKTINLIKEGKTAKGDPMSAAKIAGILAAKKTSELVPLCHPLPLRSVEVDAQIAGNSAVNVLATVKTKAQTGVEMEALVAVSVALLTIWDMTKQYEKDAKGQYTNTAIRNVRVVSKVKRA